MEQRLYEKLKHTVGKVEIVQGAVYNQGGFGGAG